MMDLMQVSRTPYDVPIVIAVNTSERMKPFEKEILSCLIDVLMCIEDLRYKCVRHIDANINAIVKLIAFNDCVVTNDIKIEEYTEATLLLRKLGDFHGAAKAETLFACLNNIFVPELYKENHVRYGNVPVVFITDGFFKDDVEVASQMINENTGFRYSTKIGLFVGNPNVSLGELLKLTGDSEACIRSGVEKPFHKLLSSAFYDYRFDEWTIDDIEEYLGDLKEWIKHDSTKSRNNEIPSGQSDDTTEQDRIRSLQVINIWCPLCNQKVVIETNINQWLYACPFYQRKIITDYRKAAEHLDFFACTDFVTTSWGDLAPTVLCGKKDGSYYIEEMDLFFDKLNYFITLKRERYLDIVVNMLQNQMVDLTKRHYGLEDKSDSSKQIHPIKDDDIDVFASLNDYDHDFFDCDDEYDCYGSVFEAHFDDGQTFKTMGRDFLGLIEPLFKGMKIDRHGISPLQEIICVKNYIRTQTKHF
jgi:hypothetical protein